MAQEIVAYTDGSFQEELGLGGWAVVYSDEKETVEFSGCDFVENVQSIEMKAIIMAIKKSPLHSKITIYTDALVIVDMFNKHIWRNKFKFMEKSNQHLWLQLEKLCKNRIVSLMWIRARTGVCECDKANGLARKTMFESKRYKVALEKLSSLNVAC
jgi:ribonuclease HI